jgi:branched-chain amino acid aminotransferase
MAREEVVRPEDFASMDECFLLSTTKDIAPVAAIDGVRFKVGPGTLSARLKAAYGDYAHGYVTAHPQLHV